MDREAWRAVIHGVTKSWTWLSDWTELNWCHGSQTHKSSKATYDRCTCNYWWECFFTAQLFIAVLHSLLNCELPRGENHIHTSLQWTIQYEHLSVFSLFNLNSKNWIIISLIMLRQSTWKGNNILCKNFPYAIFPNWSHFIIKLNCIIFTTKKNTTQ